MVIKFILHGTTRIILGCLTVLGTIIGYFYALYAALDYLPQVKDYDFKDTLIIISFILFPVIFFYSFYKVCIHCNRIATEDIQYLPIYNNTTSEYVDTR